MPHPAPLPLLNPRTGLPLPFDAEPDDVPPEDLQVDPRALPPPPMDFVAGQAAPLPPPPTPAAPPAKPPLLLSSLPPGVAPAPPRPASRPAPAPRGVPAPAPPPQPLSAAEMEAEGRRRAAAGAEVDAARRVTEAKVTGAGEEEEIAKEQARIEGEANVWAEKKRSEASAYLSRARDEIRGYHPTELFEGREAARVGAWVLAGIGQFAATMSGGPNTALQVLNGAVESWAQRERERYQRLVQKGEMAAQDAELVEAEILNKKVGIREGFINRRAEVKARQVGREAAAEGDAIEAGLQKKNAEEEMKIEALKEQRVLAQRDMARQEMLARSTVGLQAAQAANLRSEAAARAAAGPEQKPLTEAEGRSAQLGAQMVGDYEIIKKLPPLSDEGLRALRKVASLERMFENRPTLRAAAVSRGLLKTPQEVLTNDNDKRVYAAAERLAAAAVYSVSGAQASTQEKIGWVEGHIKRLGDSPATIAEKNAAIDRTIRGTLARAGRGAQVAQGLADAPSPVPSGTPVRVRLKNGQIVDALKMPDGRVVVPD